MLRIVFHLHSRAKPRVSIFHLLDASIQDSWVWRVDLSPSPSLFFTLLAFWNLYGVPFTHFHELDEIFGRDYATGKRTKDFTEAVGNMEKEGNDSSNEHGDAVESAPSTKKAKKRKGSKGASGASNALDLSILQNCMQDMNARLSTMASAWTRSQDRLLRQQEGAEELANKRDKVMDELLKLEGINLGQVIKTATILTTKSYKLNLFYQCLPSLKKHFVLCIIAPSATGFP